MPRPIRKYYDTSFFHVIVQGINKEYIFKEKTYIERYLKLLNKYKQETKIEILAYCIMNNHAHILLYTDSIEEMSKYMQKVNVAYAKYYNYKENNRVGYVFRDRYISEPINQENHLIKCINYIHLNPVKAKMVIKEEDYKYSSYNNYKKEEAIKVLSQLSGIKCNIEMFTDNKEIYLFKDIDEDIKEKVEYILKDILNISNFKKEEIIKDNIVLRILVKKLKNIYRFKYTEIMEVLNISKGRMENLKKG